MRELIHHRVVRRVDELKGGGFRTKAEDGNKKTGRRPVIERGRKEERGGKRSSRSLLILFTRLLRRLSNGRDPFSLLPDTQREPADPLIIIAFQLERVHTGQDNGGGKSRKVRRVWWEKGRRGKEEEEEEVDLAPPDLEEIQTGVVGEGFVIRT